MPIEATSAPVLQAVPATQSQPPSDMTAQPAEPLRVHVSTSGQPATFSTGAPLEARAQVDTPGGPPRGVEDAGTPRNPAIPPRDEAEAANARSKAFHRVVNELTNRLHRHQTELSHAIEDANKSNSVPGDMDRLCWSAAGALNECGQFERAIEIMELRMAYAAYADDVPRTYAYLEIADRLIAAGKSSLAVELIRRVQDPKTDLPGVHFSLSEAQLGMGDYKGALFTIEAHRNDARWPEIAAVANYKLAMLKPKGGERAALLAASDIALEACTQPPWRHQAALAGLYFDMDRVEEAMHCLKEVLKQPKAQVQRVVLPYLWPSVMRSKQRAAILESPVWAEYARVTGDPNPAHELMDSQSIEFSFHLPAIIAPPRHKILSVRDLEAQMTPSPDTRPRGESEGKR